MNNLPQKTRFTLALKPNLQVKNYLLLKELGSGTSGTVWQAQKGDTLYAIKFYYPKIEHIRGHEYHIMEQVDHVNIIDERDQGQEEIRGEDGELYKVDYLVMDYLTGHALDAKDIRGDTFESKEMLKIAYDLASGLEHVHSKGLLHRDLKPGNVFITSNNEIKILDFGESGTVEYSQYAKVEVGTIAYMAPEQLAGRINKQTDIWSYGATLYEFFTGKHPYLEEELEYASSENTERRQIRLEKLGMKMLLIELDFPHHLNPKIPAKLSWMIMKCLRKEGADRYGDFSEILHDLNNANLRKAKLRLDFWSFVSKTIAFGTAIICIAVLYSILFDGNGSIFKDGILLGIGGLMLMIIGIWLPLIIAAMFCRAWLKSKLPSKDILLSGAIVTSKRLQYWMQTMSLAKLEKKSVAELEYNLGWFWNKKEYEKAQKTADALERHDGHNIMALSYAAIMNFEKGDRDKAVYYFQKLKEINPDDTSQFLFEKVLGPQLGLDRALVTRDISDLETVVTTNQGSADSDQDLDVLTKSIMEEGSIALKAYIVQHDFRPLIYDRLKKLDEETVQYDSTRSWPLIKIAKSDSGSRTSIYEQVKNSESLKENDFPLMIRTQLEVEMILDKNHVKFELPSKENESIKYKYLASKEFKLPGTFTYDAIQNVSLNGRVLHIKYDKQDSKEQAYDGWLTLKYGPSVSMENLGRLLKRKTTPTNENDHFISNIVEKTNLKIQKRRRKIVLKLVAIVLFVLGASIGFSLGDDSSVGIILQLLTIVVLGWWLLMAIVIQMGILPTFLPVILFKAIAPNSLLKLIRYNKEDFPKVLECILQSGLESEENNKNRSAQEESCVEAKPFSFNLMNKQIAYRDQCWSFEEVSRIEVDYRSMKLELNGKDKIVFPFKDTAYSTYIPVLCQYFGDRMQLV